MLRSLAEKSPINYTTMCSFIYSDVGIFDVTG